MGKALCETHQRHEQQSMGIASAFLLRSQSVGGRGRSLKLRRTRSLHRSYALDCFAALAMTAKATRYSSRFRLVSVSQVRAMDRTAQLREKYQSACKSYGSTC